MNNMFSVGELAKLQNISKQTLIYYDAIGLFQPGYIDPETGYRYYSAKQLDYLDTILIMKKIGFSLREIKEQMEHYTTEKSILSFRQQLFVIKNKIEELSLIQERLEHRCQQVEQAYEKKGQSPEVEISEQTFLLYNQVDRPYGMKEISVATKKCYAQALKENLPIYFQCGVSVPLDRIQAGQYTMADRAFLTTENTSSVSNIMVIPKGLTVSFYHFGSYDTMDDSYRTIIQYCLDHNLRIISDSYEFCINDYITSQFEEEFITKILFYVEEERQE